jgi:hypothetical protein
MKRLSKSKNWKVEMILSIFVAVLKVYFQLMFNIQ